MDYSFLHSPSKGVWTASTGWSLLCDEAELFHNSARVQLNFRNTPDVGSVKVTSCKILTTQQTLTLLVSLHDSGSIKTSVDKMLAGDILPGIHLKKWPDSETKLKALLAGKTLNHNELRIAAEILTKITSFCVYANTLGSVFTLIPKVGNNNCDRPPLFAPVLTSSKRLPKASRGSKSNCAKHKGNVKKNDKFTLTVPQL